MIHICCGKKILVNNKPLVSKNIGDFNLFEVTEARPAAVQKVNKGKHKGRILEETKLFVLVLFITRTGNFCFSIISTNLVVYFLMRDQVT